MGGDKIREWVRIELGEGEDPEVLRRSLKAQGYDSAIVDSVMSGEGHNMAARIPWKGTLAAFFLVCLTVLAYYLINSTGKEPGGSSRSPMDIIKGDPNPVTLDVGFIEGVEKSLQGYGSFNIKSDLPEYYCYRLYTFRDSKGYSLGVEEIRSVSRECIGVKVNDTRLRTSDAVNIRAERGGTCICEDDEVNIETSGLRDTGTGRMMLNFKITEITK